MAIKLMIVDDSAVMRETLQQLLAPYPDIKVIATAMDPVLAQHKMAQNWPDVILLDVEMPRMDGLTFLRQIMSTRPTPVVICSSLTERGAATTLQALSAGAVEVICKPGLGLRGFLQDNAQQLLTAIRTAAGARVQGLPASVSVAVESRAVVSPLPVIQHSLAGRVVLMGASTGGTQALEYVLSQLPEQAPPIAIVQHMPEAFTARFAERLNSLCRIEVQEACHGDALLPGRALIAPGGRHMLIQRSGAGLQVEIKDGPLVSRHKPSVDVLFRSAASVAGSRAMAFLLTGMGSDGAQGLLVLRQAGARTLAQDEASCVVFGMPREAIKLGAVDQVVALAEIPAQLLAGYEPD